MIRACSEAKAGRDEARTIDGLTAGTRRLRWKREPGLGRFSGCWAAWPQRAVSAAVAGQRLAEAAAVLLWDIETVLAAAKARRLQAGIDDDGDLRLVARFPPQDADVLDQRALPPPLFAL